MRTVYTEHISVEVVLHGSSLYCMEWMTDKTSRPSMHNSASTGLCALFNRQALHGPKTTFKPVYPKASYVD